MILSILLLTHFLTNCCVEVYMLPFCCIIEYHDLQVTVIMRSRTKMAFHNFYTSCTLCNEEKQKMYPCRMDRMSLIVKTSWPMFAKQAPFTYAWTIKTTLFFCKLTSPRKVKHHYTSSVRTHFSEIICGCVVLVVVHVSTKFSHLRLNFHWP